MRSSLKAHNFWNFRPPDLPEITGNVISIHGFPPGYLLLLNICDCHLCVATISLPNTWSILKQLAVATFLLDNWGNISAFAVEYGHCERGGENQRVGSIKAAVLLPRTCYYYYYYCYYYCYYYYYYYYYYYHSHCYHYHHHYDLHCRCTAIISTTTTITLTPPPIPPPSTTTTCLTGKMQHVNILRQIILPGTIELCSLSNLHNTANSRLHILIIAPNRSEILCGLWRDLTWCM